MATIIDLVEHIRRRRQLEDMDIAIAEGYRRVAEAIIREERDRLAEYEETVDRR